MKLRLGISVAMALMLLAAPAAHAVYMYPWSPTPMFSDPGGDSAGPGTDLLNIWWARDGSYDYFRFDLGALPPAVDGEFFGAFVDIVPGTFFAPGGVPPGLTYADFFVGMEYTNLGGSYAWTPIIANPAGYEISGPMALGQMTENGGQTVEFRLDFTAGYLSMAPRNYLWSGVSGFTPDPSWATDVRVLDDYTMARDTIADTPEPATLALLPLGCGLLLRRLRSRTRRPE